MGQWDFKINMSVDQCNYYYSVNSHNAVGEIINNTGMGFNLKFN